MNILPKKSWHVRNKNNIERVRRDEEKAAKEEVERQRRIALAESEARTDLLRDRARKRKHSGDKKHDEVESASKHINFFEDLEQGKKIGGKNKEYEEEKKKEKEAEEKKIGLLTYLGQGSVELNAEKPWYYKAPERCRDADKNDSDLAKDEVDTKRKASLDPIYAMEKYVQVSQKVKELREGKSEKKPEPSRVSSTSTATKAGPQQAKTIEELRTERLKREQSERQRELAVLAKAHGHMVSDERSKDSDVNNERNRRYNSQFNPDFVRRPRPPKHHTLY